ncbi:5-formyltetrahydrofolate cyclo-ligase [Abyssibius alkaniclasticus]|uniref:5-formyltetrahydrofolate cyclo-ligase n=1 Tax=Abyssibius alkaniclasticus TaxID=2881234 RepID=UPI004059145F
MTQAEWRRAERQAKIAARLATSADERAEIAARVAAGLDALIDFSAKPTISLYWPFRGELDLRRWMADAHGRGATIALPLVVAKAQPLAFRRWFPGCAMTRGIWNIPIPENGPEITPNVIVAPLVGYDERNYRLGYGGGFFDRTIAGIAGTRLVIGVGHPSAKTDGFVPHEHDIPMDVILVGGAPVYAAEPGAQ